MTIEELVHQGYADYNDIKPFIKHTINKGKNEWGFVDKTIILEDGSNWDYISEDGIYELNINSAISIN